MTREIRAVPAKNSVLHFYLFLFSERQVVRTFFTRTPGVPGVFPGYLKNGI
ncbi:hypothetical protein HMPREF3039_02643 [Akkermansia sp. KLE1798]|nr:hypothetical protein HMPREF3039_02643 [Akkermansia sp. KLE1798]